MGGREAFLTSAWITGKKQRVGGVTEGGIIALTRSFTRKHCSARTKPKCHHLNPALIRPVQHGKDRKLKGLTISVVYKNISCLVMGNLWQGDKVTHGTPLQKSRCSFMWWNWSHHPTSLSALHIPRRGEAQRFSRWTLFKNPTRILASVSHCLLGKRRRWVSQGNEKSQGLGKKRSCA